MGMRVGASVFCPIPMHIEIGDHAAIDKLRLYVVSGQLNALRFT